MSVEFDAYNHVSTTTRHSPWGSFEFANQEERLAEAAADEFPDRAVALYRDLADRQIRNRQRESYAVAAGYLDLAREVLLQHGRDAEWRTLIGNVCESNGKLPTLLDELDARDLK